MAFEFPPPGVGLKTVTFADPVAMRSDGGTSMVRRVELTYVAGRSKPFQRTRELLTKLLPLTVTINGVSETRACVGFRLAMAGTGC